MNIKGAVSVDTELSILHEPRPQPLDSSGSGGRLYMESSVSSKSIVAGVFRSGLELN